MCLNVFLCIYDIHVYTVVTLCIHTAKNNFLVLIKIKLWNVVSSLFFSIQPPDYIIQIIKSLKVIQVYLAKK